MAKIDVGAGGIRVQGQRNICLGLRPIEVLFEDCGPRRDKSRKRFVRVLFNRLSRIVFGKPQRVIRIVTPTTEIYLTFLTPEEKRAVMFGVQQGSLEESQV